MKRFVFIMALCAMSIVSCQREFEDVSTQQENLKYKKHIPIEKAITSLCEVLDDIDGHTRAKRRVIKNVKTIRYDDMFSSVTRSEDVDTTELIYIVNFEDNEGYAVLSADDRIETDVLLVTDSGTAENDYFFGEHMETGLSIPSSLTLDDLYYEPEDDYYLGDNGSNNNTLIPDLVKDYVYFKINETDYPIIDGESGTYTHPYVMPILNIYWSQDYPYNLQFPLSGESEYDRWPAGCTTIALAQLLVSLADADLKNEFDIDDSTWGNFVAWRPDLADTLGSNYISDNPKYNSIRHDISTLTKKIADNIEVKYNYKNSGGTFGRPKKVKAYLEELGYDVDHKVNLVNFTKNTQESVNSSLKRGIPVWIGALSNKVIKVGGHAWLIDGCYYYEQADDWLNHCNFGWGVSCSNGWYLRDLFNSDNQYSAFHDINQNTDLKPDVVEGKNFKYNWMYNILIIE